MDDKKQSEVIGFNKEGEPITNPKVNNLNVDMFSVGTSGNGAKTYSNELKKALKKS